MEALRQFWRVLGIIFQGMFALGKKFWNYRVQKAQQQFENNQSEPESEPESEPAVQTNPPQEAEPQTTLVSEHTSSITKQPTDDVTQQIELSLVEKKETHAANLCASQWYAPGHSVQIQEIIIADGFLYVGKSLASHAGHHPTVVGLINPELSIQTVSAERRQAIFEADWSQDGILSYEILSPEMRGIFLGWLATGRKEREIPASALVLFLYGIEHRVIELLNGERTLDELLALILELERLDVHYAHHQAIHPKIQGLIECCQVQLALSCQPETLLALLPIGQKLSVALKVALGRCIEIAKPIPMTLLWAWYQSSDIAVDLKTPAKRCERAFNFLIQTRGEQQGFSITTGDHLPRLPVVYKPFSPEFGEDGESIPMINTIDIAGFEPQLAFLEPLIENCTNDLDAYSRLIGRSPEAEGTPVAVALLPQELVLLSGNDSVQEFQQWLNDNIHADDWAMVSGSELLHHWPTTVSGKIKKKEAELLGQLMAKLGFGYVPDVRYGQGTFNPKHSVGLFRLNVPGVEDMSSDYLVALMIMEMMPFVDRLTTNDTVSIVQTISSHFDLCPSERSRLNVLEQWRNERPLTWKQTLGRIKKLSIEQQKQFAIALSTELQNHWQLESAKYIELQSIIPLPKLDTQEPTSSTNPELEQTEEEEELVTTSEPVLTEEVIAVVTSPPEGDQSQDVNITSDVIPEDHSEDVLNTPGFVLDIQLIAQRNQESQVASGLLSDIFTEEDTQVSLPTPDETPLPKTAPDMTLALGLDEFHWQLLNHLGKKDSWERSELEAIAQNQGLLLDGALENINDVAFDHCDEALTEGDDPIEVNDWVFDELKAA